MENPNIKAKVVYDYGVNNDYPENKIDISDLDNISQLSKYVKNYNYGDIVIYDTYRHTGTFIIGKEGNLIENPDNSNSGYLSIPYEITQYLDDALYKYGDIYNINDIALRYDDKFIKNNINTEEYKILENWNWKLYWCDNDNIHIKFPNEESNDFNINKYNTYKIKKWYEARSEPKSSFRLEVISNDYDYTVPNIDCTWTMKQNSMSDINGTFKFGYFLEGPTDHKKEVIKTINNFYKGNRYTIIDF